MGYRNSNITSIASGDIYKGRALKMNSDGTASMITDATLEGDVVVGFSMMNHPSGTVIEIRTIFEGTQGMEMETPANITRGDLICLTDTGKVEKSGEAAATSVPVGFALEDGTGKKYCECIIYRQLLIPEIYVVS